ncbi:Type I site-specific deoxyribonuclease (fragment) [uncultured Desulfobacterium sp.]|uniref:Type I site-specific deoxyribonuclease n=1 Tax=uncultured Desulfobacterium sp. TaxID=201089 RepID=A0A445MWZ9_9BACT
MSEELEWQTRRDRINKKLEALKPPWKIIKYKDGLDTSSLDRHAVEEYPTANGPADYALFVRGKLLGIIEAKKVSVGPQNVLEQAKRYSRGAFSGPGNWDGYRVPFLYATNGEIIWHIDVRNPRNISRQISNFHTADALSDFFAYDFSSGLEKLIQNPAPVEGLWPYQLQAVESVEAAIARGKRAMLLAMATGTGKTFTTVSLIYRLLESGAARRVLFLVDRRALAAQAVREFASFTTPSGTKFNKEYEVYSQSFRKEDFGDDKSFDPKVLPNDYLTAPQATHTFVYVSTIQRMTINLLGWEHAFAQNPNDPDFEGETQQLDIPIHAFDIIIADECHRGYTAKETATWRRVMDHFDAVKVGLTATPASHTLALFREVIYRYTTEQAVLDGVLVDYEAVKIKSDVRINGIFLKPGEHVGLWIRKQGRKTMMNWKTSGSLPSMILNRRSPPLRVIERSFMKWPDMPISIRKTQAVFPRF